MGSSQLLPSYPACPLHSQQDLFRVLKAYTLYRPEEGYCQAQAPIAAVLLMHMPAEVPRTWAGGWVVGHWDLIPASKAHASLTHSKPSGVWYKSVRSTCLATTVRNW